MVFAKTKDGAIAEFLKSSRDLLKKHPIKQFRMECIPLKISQFRRIVAQLIPMKLTELHLFKCSLGVEHCQALELLIRLAPLLRVIKLGENKICGRKGDSRGVEAIFNALLRDPALYLDEMHLYRCGLGPAAAKVIIESLNSSAQEVKRGRRQYGIVKKRLNLSYNQDLKTYVESLQLNLTRFAQESGLDILLKC